MNQRRVALFIVGFALFPGIALRGEFTTSMGGIGERHELALLPYKTDEPTTRGGEGPLEGSNQSKALILAQASTAGTILPLDRDLKVPPTPSVKPLPPAPAQKNPNEERKVELDQPPSVAVSEAPSIAPLTSKNPQQINRELPSARTPGLDGKTPSSDPLADDSNHQKNRREVPSTQKPEVNTKVENSGAALNHFGNSQQASRPISSGRILEQNSTNTSTSATPNGLIIPQTNSHANSRPEVDNRPPGSNAVLNKTVTKNNFLGLLSAVTAQNRAEAEANRIAIEQRRLKYQTQSKEQELIDARSRDEQREMDRRLELQRETEEQRKAAERKKLFEAQKEGKDVEQILRAEASK